MTDIASSRQSPSKPRSWPRLLLGLFMGAGVGLGLAWFASEMQADAEQEEEEEQPLGAGDLVSLGFEVLGFVRVLLRLLKRM